MHKHLLAQNFREARREQKRAARRLTNGQHTREYTFADHELGDHNGEITSAVSSDLGFPGVHIFTGSFARRAYTSHIKHYKCVHESCHAHELIAWLV